MSYNVFSWILKISNVTQLADSKLSARTIHKIYYVYAHVWTKLDQNSIKVCSPKNLTDLRVEQEISAASTLDLARVSSLFGLQQSHQAIAHNLGFLATKPTSLRWFADPTDRRNGNWTQYWKTKIAWDENPSCRPRSNSTNSRNTTPNPRDQQRQRMLTPRCDRHSTIPTRKRPSTPGHDLLSFLISTEKQDRTKLGMLTPKNQRIPSLSHNFCTHGGKLMCLDFCYTGRQCNHGPECRYVHIINLKSLPAADQKVIIEHVLHCKDVEFSTGQGPTTTGASKQ